MSCLLTSPHAAWAELELSPRHRAPRDRGGTALLLRRPRLRRRGRRHPRPHRTFLALASRRRRVSHTAAQAAASRRVPLPSTRRSAAARAARRPSCRCHAVATRPSSPPPPAASGRCAGRSRPDPRTAVRAVVFVRVVRCISFEVHKLEFKRGEPCALSYRVVRLCRGGAVYMKNMMVARDADGGPICCNRVRRP